MSRYRILDVNGKPTGLAYDNLEDALARADQQAGDHVEEPYSLAVWLSLGEERLLDRAVEVSEMDRHSVLRCLILAYLPSFIEGLADTQSPRQRLEATDGE